MSSMAILVWEVVEEDNAIDDNDAEDDNMIFVMFSRPEYRNTS